MTDRRRSPTWLDRTEPSLPPWQSAARPGPVPQPGKKQDEKPRKARKEPGSRALPQHLLPLRSKPLKLVSKRKRGVWEYIVIVVRVCIVTIVLLLPLLLTASAPVGPLPDVETRFEAWKQAHNENTVNPLPSRASGQ